MSKLHHARVQRAYGPISIVFGILVLLLTTGVVYAGWSSTVIIVTPIFNTVTSAFPVTISTVTTKDVNELIGTITSEEKSATVTVTPAGIGTPVPTQAFGQVTIKNTTSREQPLSVGTRLQSANGIIVRTTTRVDVPAGGSIQAQVIADPLGEEGHLPPGKFIIVALWPGLQSQIYGESTTTFTGGLVAGDTMLSLDELTKASNQAEEQIRTATGPSRTGTFILTKPASVVSTPKPEIPSGSYQVTVTITITTITYDPLTLSTILRQELQKSLVKGQELKTIEDPEVSIADRPSTDTVVLTINGRASSQLSNASTLLAPATYTGLSVTEIKKKLFDPSQIKTVSVKFSPWWRTTAPDQADRISVVINPAVSL